MTIYVIAGNRQQADDWIKNDMEKRRFSGDPILSWSDYCVVGDRQQLLGIKDPHGVFVGTWRDRPDTLEILTTLLIASNNSLTLQNILSNYVQSVQTS